MRRRMIGCLWLWIFAQLGILAFPPWIVRYKSGLYRPPYDFSFLLTPSDRSYRVDLQILGIESLALALVLGGLLLTVWLNREGAEAATGGSKTTMGDRLKRALFTERRLHFIRPRRESDKQSRGPEELTERERRGIDQLRLRKRLRERLPALKQEDGSSHNDEHSGTGIPPEVLAAMVRVMAYHVEESIREVGQAVFGDTAAQINAQLGISGDEADSYLRVAWNRVKKMHPEMAKQMHND